MNTETVCDYITLFFADGTADKSELKWDIPSSAYLSNAKGLLCKVSICDAAYTTPADYEEKENLVVCYEGVLNGYSPNGNFPLGHFTRVYQDSNLQMEYGTANNQDQTGVQTVTFDEEFQHTPAVIGGIENDDTGDVLFGRKARNYFTNTLRYQTSKITYDDTAGTYTHSYDTDSTFHYLAVGDRSSSNITHQYQKNDIEYLVTARPNQIRLKFFTQDYDSADDILLAHRFGVTVKGYVTLKFEYLDPDTTKQNDINQSYKSAFPNN